MRYICEKINGVPYSKAKRRGKVDAPEKWTQAIKEQTNNLPKVKHACVLRITFLLPPDKFPADFPYGPDLDNLLKRLLDALNHTIFSETDGKDSCIISLSVMKTKVESEREAGALLEVLPVMLT
ncbi:MAG: RusA family crossover junction endodeoxyribonuclease [Planctomycetota bacterium]|jgi:Holliday junction resolvase RusA-like endonuclease